MPSKRFSNLNFPSYLSQPTSRLGDRRHNDPTLGSQIKHLVRVEAEHAEIPKRLWQDSYKISARSLTRMRLDMGAEGELKAAAASTPHPRDPHLPNSTPSQLSPRHSTVQPKSWPKPPPSGWQRQMVSNAAGTGHCTA